MPERQGSRRRTFGPVVLLGLGAGALAAVGGSKPTAAADDASSSALVSYDAHLPLVTALALVVLASWGVVLVTRGRVRRAVAALGAVAAAGAVVAVAVGYAQVPDQLRDELAQVGVSDPTVGHTAWWWITALGTVVAAVAGALAVAWTPAWPEMGTRYDAPVGGGATPEVRSAPPEEQSNLDLWKAMDDGQDPTA